MGLGEGDGIGCQGMKSVIDRDLVSLEQGNGIRCQRVIGIRDNQFKDMPYFDGRDVMCMSIPLDRFLAIFILRRQ